MGQVLKSWLANPQSVAIVIKLNEAWRNAVKKSGYVPACCNTAAAIKQLLSTNSKKLFASTSSE